MSMILTALYIIMGFVLVFTLILPQGRPLNMLESSHQVIAAETGIDTAGERAHEENTNFQNGFSPAGAHPNVTQGFNNSLQSNSLALSNLIALGSPVYGNRSAPITIVEFGDFQCRFCDRFAKQTEPALNMTYLLTGKVNLVFRHFVTHGSDSFNAAMASQCANGQSKFWKFYQILYDNQGEENSGWASIDNLKKFAAGIIGLNTHEFNSCLDSQKYKSFVENDTIFAVASGFQGTPTFIIEKPDGSDREVLLGAYPFPSFQAIIEKKLSRG
jgi:protein-disulfide isomerase